MDINLQSRIDAKINLNISNLLSSGTELLKESWGIFIGYLVITLVINIGLSFVPFLGGLASMVINPILTLGFYIAADMLQHNERIEMDSFFLGFKSNVAQIIVTSLLIILIFIALFVVIAILAAALLGLTIGFDAFQDFNPDMFTAGFVAGMVLLYLLILIPAIYLSMAYAFAYLFVYFKGLDAWQAMEASRQMVHNNFWQYFVLFLVLGLINMLTVFTLFIGLLFTIPLTRSVTYIVFNEVIGARPESEDAEQDVMDHLLA